MSKAALPFSLIEVMIVIVLVGVVAGVCLFSLRPLYVSYRFRLEARALYELFQELQLEAMTLQSDIQVKFTDKKGKWVAQSLSEEPLLKPQTIDLSHIDQISNTSSMVVYSNGLVEPRGLLQLSNKEEHRCLDFRGGHLIKFWEKDPL
jgi:prepilin-type N-terminal cleavage/methylation domain-containing protein